MLIYEAEGFLEVETDSITQLCRSRDHVSFSGSGGSSFDVHAILCDFHENSQSRCCVAFHDKALKKALVFSVKSPGEKSAWQHGHDTLAGLGYHLDEVRLKLSPAMLEVVLRDIPGFASPAEARKQKSDRASFLAGLQETVETSPDSAAGRKAALSLGAEKRLQERLEELRQLMIDVLSPAEERDADSQAMMEQISELTARLETAEGLVEQERKQREISESITEAAEKRIRELEEILVEVETRSAGEIKYKRRIVALRQRVKELEEQMAQASDELAKEHRKQEQFVTDVKQAHDQIAVLEDSLYKAEKMLADSYDQLAQEQDAYGQMETSLQNAQSRIGELEEELRGLGQQSVQREEANQAAEESQAKLDALQREMSDLRQEHLQECTLRKQLEKSAAQDIRKIRELEEALEEAKREAAELSAGIADASVQNDLRQDKTDDLQRLLREERAAKEALERDLEQAHKIIDSLEKMVRESENPPVAEDAENPEDRRELLDLNAEIALLREQVARERTRQKELVDEIAAAEQKLAEKGSAAGKMSRTIPVDSATAEAREDGKPDKPRKPLPHELRPAPDKKAFFRPDWDLEGLPCKSEKQVVRAWETVFNVQISLEGYPSQYCMAFLVVLRIDNVNKLYMLYRLKQSKHTLVCVPASPPENEARLQKAIDEGLRFLKNSGFEMEEMPEEYVASSLGSYFLKG